MGPPFELLFSPFLSLLIPTLAVIALALVFVQMRHQRSLAELRLRALQPCEVEPGALPSQLRQDMRVMREEFSQYAMSLDASVKTLGERLAGLEARVVLLETLAPGPAAFDSEATASTFRATVNPEQGCTAADDEGSSRD